MRYHVLKHESAFKFTRYAFLRIVMGSHVMCIVRYIYMKPFVARHCRFNGPIRSKVDFFFSTSHVHWLKCVVRMVTLGYALASKLCTLVYNNLMVV